MCRQPVASVHSSCNYDRNYYNDNDNCNRSVRLRRAEAEVDYEAIVKHEETQRAVNYITRQQRHVDHSLVSTVITL